MRRERFLECLAADEARLRELAAGDRVAKVPSCPDWTMSQLAEHVAAVYLHKVESMRTGGTFEWPPDFSGEETLALLDRAYRALTEEFAVRPDDEATTTWYEPDQTVGFWVRRMAQETVIHRIDAELAVGAPISEVPADQAIDGIDEVLITFLAYAAEKWPEDFTDELPSTARRVLVGAETDGWLIGLGPAGITVERQAGERPAVERQFPDGSGDIGDAAPAATVDATVTGAPADVLRWLWRRADADAVTIGGDPGAADHLRRAMGPATQ